MRVVPAEPGRGQPALGALFGLVMLAGAAGASVWLRLGLPVPACLFHEWTGLPCPTCGTTRLVDAVLRGEWLAAAAWNPLVFSALLGVALWAALSCGRWALGLPERRVIFEARERLALRVGAGIVLAAGWGWLIWRGV